MPTYAYDCPTCGGFDLDRPLAEYDLPAACPGCAQVSPRALTLPRFASMDGVRRLAAATNERSANAPRSSRTHGGGCACCAPRRADAVKGSPAARPWMISH